MNVNGTPIPAAGEAPIDLASALQSALTGNGMTELTIQTASLEHQANDEDGNDVYFFTLTGQAIYQGETRDMTLYLKHNPQDEDNSTYRGKLSYAITDNSGDNLGNCNDVNTVGSSTSDTLVEAGTILYNKDSATSLTYRLQQGKFCDSSQMPLDTTEDYDIDPTDAASEDNPTGYANGFQYYLINMNPEKGTGSFAFAWVAGTGREQTRTLNVTLGERDDGSLGGCAYFGYGPQVSTAGDSLGSIDGFICNWGLPSTELPIYQLVQRQCVSLDATSNTYKTDETIGSLAIQYAPTASCDTDAGNEFIYYSRFSTENDPDTNDRYTDTEAVTNNLVNINEMDFTLPTIPDDVY